jgi:hypothetical protein
MGTCHFQAPTGQKPLDRSFCNFAQLIASARPLNLLKMLIFGWLGAAPHIGEMEALYTLLCITLPSFYLAVLQARPLNRFARIMVKQRGLTQGSAFWGLIDEKC